MEKSTILDKYGNNYIMVKNSEVPNLDSDFWNIMSSNNQSISDILDKPYLFNHWILSCVRSIAQNISQLERNFHNIQNDNVNKDHRILKLFQRPNKFMDYYSFFYNIICQLLLPSKGKKDATSGGQSFIVPWNGQMDEPVNLRKGEIPTELMPFSSLFFKPWYEKNNRNLQNLKGWTFEIPSRPDSRIDFLLNEIIVITVINPYDYLSGSTPFSTIAETVKTEANADTYNNKVFENDGKLDGMVSAKEFIPSEELKKYKKEWMNQYTGNSKDRIAFLSGGMQYQQFATSAHELGFIDQSKWNRQKILAAYGLNRIAIGDYEDINKATIQEGRKLLWYDRYIPLDKLINSAFNGQWVQNTDNGKWKLKSDYSNVPALQTDMRERVRTGSDLCVRWAFPPELSARILNIPLTKEDLKRWPHLTEAVKQSSNSNNSDEIKSINKTIVDKDLEIYSKSYIKNSLDPAEKKCKVTFDKYFISQRNKILDKVDEIVQEKSINVKEMSFGAYKFLPDQDYEDAELMRLYKLLVMYQAGLEKKQVENELNTRIEWDTSQTRIDFWVSTRAAFVQGINTHTFKIARNAINATVKQGIDDGITVTEMRKEIKKTVQDIYKVRLGQEVVPNGKFDLGGMSSSKTIARTEMGTIASLTRADIFRTEGIERIKWITSHDEKVRESHRILDNKTTEFNNVFEGSQLRWPRDQHGSAKEVINCRCAFVAVFDEE